MELDFIAFSLSHHLKTLRISESYLQCPQPSILGDILVKHVNQLTFQRDCNYKAFQPLAASHGRHQLHIFGITLPASALTHLKVQLLELISIQHGLDFFDLLLLPTFVELVEEIRVL